MATIKRSISKSLLAKKYSSLFLSSTNLSSSSAFTPTTAASLNESVISSTSSSTTSDTTATRLLTNKSLDTATTTTTTTTTEGNKSDKKRQRNNTTRHHSIGIFGSYLTLTRASLSLSSTSIVTDSDLSSSPHSTCNDKQQQQSLSSATLPSQKQQQQQQDRKRPFYLKSSSASKCAATGDSNNNNNNNNKMTSSSKKLSKSSSSLLCTIKNNDNNNGQKMFKRKLKIKLFEQPLSKLVVNNQLPVSIQNLLYQLYLKGPGTVGIFRKSANSRHCKELRATLESNCYANIEQTPILVVASVFKELLRSMPDCLLMGRHYHDWIEAIKQVEQSHDDDISQTKASSHIKKLLDSLNEANMMLLRHCMCILWHIAHTAHYNKMSSTNLGVCIGQSLLFDGRKSLANHSIKAQTEMSEYVPKVISYLIDNCINLFGQDVVHIYGDRPAEYEVHQPLSTPAPADNSDQQQAPLCLLQPIDTNQMDTTPLRAPSVNSGSSSGVLSYRCTSSSLSSSSSSSSSSPTDHNHHQIKSSQSTDVASRHHVDNINVENCCPITIDNQTEILKTTANEDTQHRRERVYLSNKDQQQQQQQQQQSPLVISNVQSGPITCNDEPLSSLHNDRLKSASPLLNNCIKPIPAKRNINVVQTQQIIEPDHRSNLHHIHHIDCETKSSTNHQNNSEQPMSVTSHHQMTRSPQSQLIGQPSRSSRSSRSSHALLARVRRARSHSGGGLKRLQSEPNMSNMLDTQHDDDIDMTASSIDMATNDNSSCERSWKAMSSGSGSSSRGLTHEHSDTNLSPASSVNQSRRLLCANLTERIRDDTVYYLSLPSIHRHLHSSSDSDNSDQEGGLDEHSISNKKDDEKTQSTHHLIGKAHVDVDHLIDVSSPSVGSSSSSSPSMMPIIDGYQSQVHRANTMDKLMISRASSTATTTTDSGQVSAQLTSSSSASSSSESRSSPSSGASSHSSCSNNDDDDDNLSECQMVITSSSASSSSDEMQITKIGGGGDRNVKPANANGTNPTIIRVQQNPSEAQQNNKPRIGLARIMGISMSSLSQVKNVHHSHPALTGSSSSDEDDEDDDDMSIGSPESTVASTITSSFDMADEVDDATSPTSANGRSLPTHRFASNTMKQLDCNIEVNDKARMVSQLDVVDHSQHHQTNHNYGLNNNSRLSQRVRPFSMIHIGSTSPSNNNSPGEIIVDQQQGPYNSINSSFSQPPKIPVQYTTSCYGGQAVIYNPRSTSHSNSRLDNASAYMSQDIHYHQQQKHQFNSLNRGQSMIDLIESYTNLINNHNNSNKNHNNGYLTARHQQQYLQQPVPIHQQQYQNHNQSQQQQSLPHQNYPRLAQSRSQVQLLRDHYLSLHHQQQQQQQQHQHQQQQQQHRHINQLRAHHFQQMRQQQPLDSSQQQNTIPSRPSTTSLRVIKPQPQQQTSNNPATKPARIIVGPPASHYIQYNSLQFNHRNNSGYQQQPRSQQMQNHQQQQQHIFHQQRQIHYPHQNQPKHYHQIHHDLPVDLLNQWTESTMV